MRCRSSFSSHLLTLASAALLVMLPVSPVHAQGTVVGVISDQRMPDSAQQAAILGMSTRLRSPAAMALSIREELGLSPEQVSAIEALVPIEADSVRARMDRMTGLLKQNAAKTREQNLMNNRGADALWTGPIDEAAIRTAACEQSRASADMMIGLMRDRHALGILLTPEQRQQFDHLQGEMMMRIMRPAINK